MKTKDVDTLNQVLLCLQEQSPIESDLLEDFSAAVSNCTMALEKQKQRYQDNALYHRQKTREWVKNHPERVRKHQQEYQMRKKQKSAAANIDKEEKR